jgi:hypothetical protein
MKNTLQKDNLGDATLDILASNPRLLQNGEPHPDFFWANKADYGFVSPMREYIESPTKPLTVPLCTKWKVSFVMIRKWYADQNWEAIRNREWADIEKRRWSLSKDAIASVQKEELAVRLGIWTQLRASLEAMLRHGVIKEQTATGQYKERYMNPREWRETSQTLEIIDNQLDKIYGLGKGLLALGEISEEERTARPVRRIRHNYTITEEITNSPLDNQTETALPAPSEPKYVSAHISTNVSEGEVIE